MSTSNTIFFLSCFVFVAILRTNEILLKCGIGADLPFFWLKKTGCHYYATRRIAIDQISKSGKKLVSMECWRAFWYHTSFGGNVQSASPLDCVVENVTLFFPSLLLYRVNTPCSSGRCQQMAYGVWFFGKYSMYTTHQKLPSYFSCYRVDRVWICRAILNTFGRSLLRPNLP